MLFRSDLGKEFGVMPAEVADAMYGVVGNLGYTKDSVDQVRQSILLAKAGASTTSEAFGLLSAVTRAYGDTSAESMHRVADLSAATVRLGALTMPELAASIQQVTPLAKTLGVSLDELFATQASLSGVTGSASEVYTQMEGALAALLKKTPQMEKAWKKTFGKQTAEQAIGKYGVQGVLQRLVDFTKGNKDMLVDMFGRKEAMQYVFALTGNLADDYRGKLGQLKGVTNEVSNAVAKQTTGMGAAGFALDKAKAAAEAQRIELGEKLAPAFVNLQILGGQVAKSFGDEIMPLFLGVTNQSEAMATAIDTIRDSFHGVAQVVRFLMLAIDPVITAVATLTDYVMGLLVVLGNAATGDFAGAAAVMEATGQSVINRVKDLGGREMERLYMLDEGSTPQQRAAAAEKAWIAKSAAESAAESANRDQLRSRIGGFAQAAGNWFSQPINANVGGVTVNVTVPAGTEAQGAARIADQGAKVMMQQFMANVQQAFPVGADSRSAW